MQPAGTGRCELLPGLLRCSALRVGCADHLFSLQQAALHKISSPAPVLSQTGVTSHHHHAHLHRLNQEGLLNNMSSCKDANLCKPPRPREGISMQFTSTQLLQEPTNQEGSKAHAKHVKKQGLGVSSAPLKPQQPSKSRGATQHWRQGSSNQCETAQIEWISTGGRCAVATGKDCSIFPSEQALKKPY